MLWRKNKSRKERFGWGKKGKDGEISERMAKKNPRLTGKITLWGINPENGPCIIWGPSIPSRTASVKDGKGRVCLAGRLVWLEPSEI